MRLLFEMDRKDYDKCTHEYMRNSSRAIIICNNRLALVHSLRYDYFKFPGGGIEDGESRIGALIRETREETGLVIIRDSIVEHGYVHRIQKSNTDETECFIQDNYYYFCDVRKHMIEQKLDRYEEREYFTLEFVDPEVAISINSKAVDIPYDLMMLERESRVIKMLIESGYL